ncbi:MAG: RNA polymerase sigma factor [Clostridia bacterium]|nr:RNA polymerase sigma factor [Clostridia bacterium]
MSDFEKLFSENQDFIYKYLLKLCKNSDLAQELTQETFFRAYINISRLKDESKASCWLCQIAKNTYFAYYNGQKKTAPLSENEADPFTVTPEEAFINKELTSQAMDCLHRLNEPYKEVFMLCVFGQISLRVKSIIRTRPKA